MEKKIELHNPKQVMEALLAGHKVSNTEYFNGWGNDIEKEPEHYLYLDENGYIVEEDGATAKNGRIPIAMRSDVRWWIVDSNQ